MGSCIAASYKAVSALGLAFTVMNAESVVDVNTLFCSGGGALPDLIPFQCQHSGLTAAVGRRSRAFSSSSALLPSHQLLQQGGALPSRVLLLNQQFLHLSFTKHTFAAQSHGVCQLFIRHCYSKFPMPDICTKSVMGCMEHAPNMHCLSLNEG